MKTKYEVEHAGEIVRKSESQDFALTFAELLSARVIGRVKVVKITGIPPVSYTSLLATFENGKEY